MIVPMTTQEALDAIKRFNIWQMEQAAGKKLTYGK